MGRSHAWWRTNRSTCPAQSAYCFSMRWSNGFLVAVLLAAGVVACGGSSGTPDAPNIMVLGPDANVDAPLNNTTPISLFADGDNVQLLLYRDGAGPWQAPTPGSDPGMYTINVSNDYQVVLVCATGSDFDAEELNATLGENSMPFVFCGTGATSTAGTVKVSG